MKYIFKGSNGQILDEYSVELQKNGFPPHYVYDQFGTRYVRRGNKKQGHWYEYWAESSKKATR